MLRSLPRHEDGLSCDLANASLNLSKSTLLFALVVNMLMGSMIGTWVVLGMALIALVFVRSFGAQISQFVRSRYPRQLTKWTPLRLQIRIAWGTYQVLSSVPSIYQLSLPPTVASIINSNP